MLLVSTTGRRKRRCGMDSVNLRSDTVEIELFELESLILAQNERWRQA
jgi:hypothetical protein